MNLNALALTKQMGTRHFGIYKKINFHVGSVGIFVIISVCLPLPSENENVKRKTLSACEGQIFTGRITHLGGSGVLEAIVVVWYDSKAPRHCGKHSQMMEFVFHCIKNWFISELFVFIFLEIC